MKDEMKYQSKAIPLRLCQTQSLSTATLHKLTYAEHGERPAYLCC